VHIDQLLSFFFLFNLDRYGSTRYRGGATSNSGISRRRNSRSRSRSPRDRDGRNDRTHRDRYQQRSERPNKRYSRSRSRTRSPSPKAFGNKIVEKRLDTTKRIFDRKKIDIFFLFLNFFENFFLASELQGKTEDEIEMLKTMGFASFDSTKVSYHLLKSYFI
jgi:U4/U6.U5 tri-snRNP-associated protein 3